MPKKKKSVTYPPPPAEQINPLDGIILHEGEVSRDERDEREEESNSVLPSPASRPSRDSSDSALPTPNSPLHLVYENAASGLWLYNDNCLAVLDAIYAKYPEGRFDCIFADPPYFLSNGGITCHAGKMVKVDKGDWDKSRGWEWNHEFNRAWLERCQRVLKPNGTIWVTGTHHVIFSVGFAMQQLGYKILNDIAWEKPNPPPNLSCRYFTHSTETILWAAKNDKSKHTFNYAAMKAITGKQMKTVWRAKEFNVSRDEREEDEGKQNPPFPSSRPSRDISDSGTIWTMSAPGRDEKQHGKHPTQKPVALIERCLLASTNPHDLVLDPFMGAGTTAIACVRLSRDFVGIELDAQHFALAQKRTDRETVLIWLRTFRIEISISIYGRAKLPLCPNIRAARQRRPTVAENVSFQPHSDPEQSTIHHQLFLQKDLDPDPRSMDRIRWMEDTPPKTDCIFHEVKFVFLSCAHVSEASVVHTTVDVNLQEAWAKTPNGKKRETTHVVKCETEIFRLADKTGV